MSTYSSEATLQLFGRNLLLSARRREFAKLLLSPHKTIHFGIFFNQLSCMLKLDIFSVSALHEVVTALYNAMSRYMQDLQMPKLCKAEVNI